MKKPKQSHARAETLARIFILERQIAVLKEANRLLGERLIDGRPLKDVVARRPAAGGAA